MNILKTILLTVILPALFGVGGGVALNVYEDKPAFGPLGAIGASVFFPYQGGTGTGTVPTSGQLLIGTSGGLYTPANLTAGSNVTISNGSGTITVAAAGFNGLNLRTSGGTFAHYDSVTFDAGMFDLATLASASTLRLDWTNGPASRSAAQTITGAWDFSTNPTFAGGYALALTASQSAWETFRDTPSTRITAGTNLSWSGNTLNATGGGVASNSLDFDEFVVNMTLDQNHTVASGGFRLNFTGGGLGVKSGGTLNTPFEVGGIASISTLYVGNGTAAAPSVTFANDTNTGIYNVAANQLGFSVNGAQVLRFTTVSTIFSQRADHIDGSVGGPGITFATDSNTGIYRIADDTLGFSTGGVQRASISASRWEFNVGASVSGKFFVNGLSAGAAGDDDVCMSATTNEFTDAGASTCVVSSRRFKENIKPITGSLNKVLQLNAVSYNYKPELDSSKVKKKPRIGLIAEDMEKVEKRLVFYEPDGKTPRGISYEEYTAILTQAIQELNAKVEKQDARISALEARVALLDGKTPPVGGETPPESNSGLWERLWTWIKSLIT